MYKRNAAKRTSANDISLHHVTRHVSPCALFRQDAYWASHGENDKSKAAKKREEEERKRAETAAKKAEAKRLADAELEELGKAKARAEKAGSQKVGHMGETPVYRGCLSWGSWAGPGRRRRGRRRWGEGNTFCAPHLYW